jgi:hypothetical protein
MTVAMFATMKFDYHIQANAITLAEPCILLLPNKNFAHNGTKLNHYNC